MGSHCGFNAEDQDFISAYSWKIHPPDNGDCLSSSQVLTWSRGAAAKMRRHLRQTHKDLRTDRTWEGRGIKGKEKTH